jgi:hypothetical protein
VTCRWKCGGEIDDALKALSSGAVLLQRFGLDVPSASRQAASHAWDMQLQAEEIRLLYLEKQVCTMHECVSACLFIAKLLQLQLLNI